MTTNTDRVVLYGLLALIAWELWPKEGLAQPTIGCASQSTETPQWVQQLSDDAIGGNFFTPNCNTWCG